VSERSLLGDLAVETVSDHVGRPHPRSILQTGKRRISILKIATALFAQELDRDHDVTRRGRIYVVKQTPPRHLPAVSRLGGVGAWSEGVVGRCVAQSFSPV
jgi:hypothetical protein